MKFTKSLQRSNSIAREIVKSTKDRNLFERSTIAKDDEYFRKRRENIRRKQREDELEASSITGVTKREGTLTAKSTKGFLGRILDFFGIILIGWFVNRLPGIIKAIGNVINLIKKATGFLTGFVDGVRDFLTTIGEGIKSALDSFPKFDFLNFKNESNKVLDNTANIGQKLEQDLFFATKESNDTFNNVFKDNPDLNPDTGLLQYSDEQEAQLRGEGGGESRENEQEEGESAGITSAEGVTVGDQSNIEGTKTTVEEEEIQLGDDGENKKIEEEIDKLNKSGERLQKTKEDEKTKELGSEVESTTDGIGGGGTGGGGGVGSSVNVKGEKNNLDDKKLVNDKKDEEVDEEDPEGEKGVPIKNKRGRIIGYKKVDPAQITQKDDLIMSSTSQNVEMSEFDERKKEIILQEKYGGTGRPITVGDKTYNPGDDGYIEAFNMIQGVTSRSGAIVPISKGKNDLVMTNKSDRPTIIFSDVGAPVSSSPSMGGGGGNSGDIFLNNSNDSQTMKKIHTLILET